MSDIKPITFYRIISYVLYFTMAVAIISTVDDVRSWIGGRPQNMMGILLPPIFNPVILFLDTVVIYMIMRQIKKSRKMIKELKWR